MVHLGGKLIRISGAKMRFDGSLRGTGEAFYRPLETWRWWNATKFELLFLVRIDTIER
jgi:hypothetical protein